MSHLDRLSSLLSNFEVKAECLLSPQDANLFIYGDQTCLDKLVLVVDSNTLVPIEPEPLVCIHVDIGDDKNPLHQAMPEYVEIDLKHPNEFGGKSNVQGIAHLIVTEASMSRCGGRFALDRLCDLLVVNILRHQIAEGKIETGIFAGLAHPKLRHVVVAIHDNPHYPWKIEDFVEIAAMSRSQFMAVFNKVLGYSPITYVRLWRMTAARLAILNGKRVKEVANKYGYASGDAFCRAFVSTYGVSPTQMSREH